MAAEEKQDAGSHALLYCFVAVVLAVSLVGFLRGVNVSKAEMESHVVIPETPPDTGDVSVPAARSYAEMRLHPPGEGSGWKDSLRKAQPAKQGKVTAKDLERALARRAKSRAYDGAPPTIPHSVRQNSAAECMACHGQYFTLGQAQAQGVPHDTFTSCTQCHVVQEAPMPGGSSLARDPREVDNSFKGVKPVARGPRAWSIAPPQIPHTTFMRENCMACHGESGPSPMRTSHTSRQSCTQCHASSAALDGRPDLNAWEHP